MNGVAHIFNAILNTINLQTISQASIISQILSLLLYAEYLYIYITQIYKNSQDRIEATRGVIYQKQKIGTEIDVDLIPVN